MQSFGYNTNALPTETAADLEVVNVVMRQLKSNQNREIFYWDRAKF